jgi:hypothetical protein
MIFTYTCEYYWVLISLFQFFFPGLFSIADVSIKQFFYTLRSKSPIGSNLSNMSISLLESLWAVGAGLEEDSVLLSVAWIQGTRLGFYIKV